MVPQWMKTEGTQQSIVYEIAPQGLDKVEGTRNPRLPLTPGRSGLSPVSDKVKNQLERLATEPKATPSYEQPGAKVMTQTFRFPGPASTTQSSRPPGVSQKLEDLIKGSFDVSAQPYIIC